MIRGSLVSRVPQRRDRRYKIYGKLSSTDRLIMRKYNI